MVLYVFVSVLLLGILFLLYCLWNFTRELKPRSTRVFALSKWPTWGFVHPMHMSLAKGQDLPFKSRAKAVNRPGHDYQIPARAS